MSSSTEPTKDEKKSWFETVIVSTPVILTVIATFLIGRSSAEMTLAQYYRSVASQNQSKVGDQWGFFQAKRVRGQIMETQAGLLLAQKRNGFSRDTLVDTAQQMLDDLQVVEKIIKSNDPALAKEMHALTAKAMDALAATKSLVDASAEKAKDVQEALDALHFKPAEKSTGNKEAGKPADLLAEVVSDIKKRTPERDRTAKVLSIPDETLRKAIDQGESRAGEITKRGKAIDAVLEDIDALVDGQTALAFAIQPIVARFRRLPNVDGIEVKIVEKEVDAMRELSANLQGDYQVVRLAFDARRYEADARGNQDLAYLYEVKVLQSSARSDKHLLRSQMFLIAMLVAQAGVTIATLALAVRRKSIFWSLATVAGLAAIAFGIYVYFDMPAIPDWLANPAP